MQSSFFSCAILVSFIYIFVVLKERAAKQEGSTHYANTFQLFERTRYTVRYVVVKGELVFYWSKQNKSVSCRQKNQIFHFLTEPNVVKAVLREAHKKKESKRQL